MKRFKISTGIATILVERVTRKAAGWIAQGKLLSTTIADDTTKQQQFLEDWTAFLGCVVLRPSG